MQKVIFVIGANAAGKTYFIEHHLASEKAVVLNIYDYQQKVYDEHGNKELITFEEQFRCLKKANEKHLHDIINELKLSMIYGLWRLKIHIQRKKKRSKKFYQK